MSLKDKMDQDPTSYNNPGRKTLDETDVEGLGMAVLALTQEIWVLRDRLMTMEKVLAEKGMDISEDIEQFQPDDEFQNQLKEQGQDLIEKVLSALNKTR